MGVSWLFDGGDMPTRKEYEKMVQDRLLSELNDLLAENKRLKIKATEEVERR